jgi:hypothetical protein
VTAPVAAAAGHENDDDDDGLCTICFDQPATCVLMECGHGGYCWRCAHVLFARPPSECPICRQSIMQVRALRRLRLGGLSTVQLTGTPHCTLSVA